MNSPQNKLTRRRGHLTSKAVANGEMLMRNKERSLMALNTPSGIIPLFFLALCASFTVAQAAPPTIAYIEPQAVLPGEAIDLTVRGSNLAGATELWTSFPCGIELAADIEKNGTQADRVVFRIAVPAETRVGIHGLRVTTPEGTSGIKLLAVDDLPSEVRQAKTTLTQPQTVSAAAAIDGHVDALGRDYYAFEVEAGQRVSFEVLARRLGSAMDPLILLLDAQGRELTYNDDVPGLGSDAQLDHTFSVGGRYLLQVRDIRYRGGSSFRYRLRIGDFPLVTTPYPMGATRGSEPALNFAGASVDNVPSLTLKVPTDPAVQSITIGAKRDGGRNNGFAALSLGDRPEILEEEPNDQKDGSNRVSLGANLNGRLHRPGDVDRFVFAASNGQKFGFSAITRHAGSPADLLLRMFNPEGKQVAEAEDAGTDDGVLKYTFPADGDYTLAVEDLHGRGGSSFTYRVRVAELQKEFSLSAASDKLNVPAGGTAILPVTASRTNYNGPIQLSVAELPPGVTSVPTVIGAGQTSAVLTVQSQGNAQSGKRFPVRIVGKARIGDADFEATASVSAALKAALNQMPYPPQLLSHASALAISPRPSFVLRTEPASITFGRELQAKVKVMVERGEGFNEEIKLALSPEKKGLPDGVQAKLQPIPKDQQAVEIVFSATGKAPLGEFTAVLLGTLTKDKKETVQPAPGVGLKLDIRLRVTAKPPAETLQRGKQLKMKVTVQRNPALTAPVMLSVENLPAGVTAEAATLPAEQIEVEILLSAAQDAQIGKWNSVKVKGDAKLEKKSFSASSAALPLTIGE
jgi:hypothetical protein